MDLVVVDEGVVVGGIDVKGEYVGNGTEADSETVTAGKEHLAGAKSATCQPRRVERPQSPRQLYHIPPQHRLWQ